MLRLLLIVIWMAFMPYMAHGYNYEVLTKGGHKVHVVTLDPNEYQAEIVKAHNSVLGRETVEAIAKREGADIAINAGFFEIAGATDGAPSGTLIAEGKIYGLKFGRHSVLAADLDGHLNIQTIHPTIKLQIADKTIDIRKLNKPLQKSEPIIYTAAYSQRTLTPLRGRSEITFNESGQMLKGGYCCDTIFSKDEFVVSLPDTMKLSNNMRLKLSDPIARPPYTSMVWGTPKLIENGEIYSDVRGNGSFYKLPHARTAVGIKSDGSVVVVVAENGYTRDLSMITIGEIQPLLKNQRADIRMDEVKAILKKEFSPKNSRLGLTMMELATLMKSLGCDQAINLDGGGSSTLWVDGQVVNTTIGDKDEGNGMRLMRPVSDAIVFRKNRVN